jgi:hypothetical protein
MVATHKLIQVPVAADEKSTSVFIYTETYILWGELVTKDRIRVSTWLRTNVAPEVICIYNAMLLYPESVAPKPITFPEIHLATTKVSAFHLMPPATDPIDYDPNEANRKMEPITALVGSFRMDGSMRVALSSSLKKYLEISRELFTPIYDVTVSHPSLTQMNLPKVSYVLVRQATTTFATRNPIV